jgi:hypothetical protein
LGQHWPGPTQLVGTHGLVAHGQTRVRGQGNHVGGGIAINPAVAVDQGGGKAD